MAPRPMVVAALLVAALAACACAGDAPAPAAATTQPAQAGGEQAEAPEGRPSRSGPGYLPYSEPGLPETPGVVSIAGRVLGSLALVVGLIFITALLLRRYLGTIEYA